MKPVTLFGAAILGLLCSCTGSTDPSDSAAIPVEVRLKGRPLGDSATDVRLTLFVEGKPYDQIETSLGKSAPALKSVAPGSSIQVQAVGFKRAVGGRKNWTWYAHATGIVGDAISAQSVLATIQPIPSGSPLALHGALRVADGVVRDGNGDTARLEGMSFYPTKDFASQFHVATALEVLARDWQASIVRVPVAAGDYISNPDAHLDRVRTVVNAATSRGLYAVIDWHDDDKTGRPIAAAAFWAKILDQYGGNPAVVFEIWNVPDLDSWTLVKSYAQAVLPDIRRRTPNLVIVGTPQYSKRPGAVGADRIDDPNLAYGLHAYIEDPTAFASANLALRDRLPMFLTEIGAAPSYGGSEANVDTLKAGELIDWARTNGIPWTGWSLGGVDEAFSAWRSGALSGSGLDPAKVTTAGRFFQGRLLESRWKL